MPAFPQISPSATTPVYTKQGFKGAFRVVANDNKLGGTLGRYAVDKLGAKSIAVIDDRTAYGQGVADEFVKGAKAKSPGVKIVGKEFTNANATDFTAILTSIKAKKPDLIFFGGMDSVGGPMLKQMKALGIKAKFMGGDGVCTEALSTPGRRRPRRRQRHLRRSRRCRRLARKSHGRLPRPLQAEIRHRRAAVRALRLRRRDDDGHRHAERQVGRSRQVPA